MYASFKMVSNIPQMPITSRGMARDLIKRLRVSKLNAGEACEKSIHYVSDSIEYLGN